MIAIKQFPFHEPRPSARVRLVCLPFAGGAALTFRAWPKAVPDWIEVCAYEGSAHGTRMKDAPNGQMSRVLDDIQEGLLDAEKRSGRKPVALFGHSMGGRIAFALARTLVPAPIHLFVSACRSPFSAIRIRSNLPRDALISEMRRLGGTPREVLDDSEMMDFVLPTLRADFSLVETPLETAPVAFPITAFGGTADPEVKAEELASWEQIAGGSFSLRSLDASHFYLESHRDEVLRHVIARLDSTAG